MYVSRVRLGPAFPPAVRAAGTLRAMSQPTKLGNRLTQALQSAVVSGGPTLAALRQHFAALEPRDSLNNLILNAVDPELLEAVLGPKAAAPWVKMLWVQYARFREKFPADWPDFEAAWHQQRAQWRSPRQPRPRARDYPEHDPAAPPGVSPPGAVPRVVSARAPVSRTALKRPALPVAASPAVPVDQPAPEVLEESSLDAPPPDAPAPPAVFKAPADPPPALPSPPPVPPRPSPPSASQPPVSFSAGLGPPPASADVPGHVLERMLAAVSSGDRDAVEAARALWLRGGPGGVLYALVACAFSPAVSERLRTADRRRDLAAVR